MTDNIDKIVQEAECVAAADEYFKARTWLMDTTDNRRIFEAGFDRAYALLSKLRAPVADERGVLPCPFCGSEAFATYKTDDDDDIRRHSVHCRARCGAQMGGSFVSHYSEESAVKAWNRRAARASAPVAPQACPTDVCQAAKADGVRPASAPVAGEAQPSDIDILGLAGQYIQPSPVDVAPQASEAVRDAGIAESEDVMLPPLPEALALQPGQLGYSGQTLDCFARASVIADRQRRAALSAQPGAQTKENDS